MPAGDFKDSILKAPLPEDSSSDVALQGRPAEHGSTDAFSEFAAGAWSSFKYSLVQAPLTGVTQLVDKVAGTEWEQKTKFFEKPAQAQFGSSAWVGEAVGGTVGAALPFVFMARVAGPGAAAKMEQSAQYGLASRQAISPIMKAVGAGVAYNGIFTPVEPGEDFLSARARNMAVGGLTWGSLTATSVGLKGLGLRAFNQTAIAEAQGLAPAAKYTEGLFANSAVRSVLKNDIFNAAAGGTVGGIVDVQSRSLLSGHGLASAGETAQGAATFALGGALMGGTNILYEKVRPTSGDRRYRTLEDITKVADATRDPNAPARYHYDNLAAQEGLAANGRHEHISTLKGMIEQSRLPEGEQGKVLRAHQDLVAGLEAVHEQGPVGVMYGSARTKSDTFAYQRGRLTSALVAKEGYPMMTGGGPGMMEAGNRGAYEAGGKSIGVSLELPHEPIGNGYQTTILSAKDFGPRKEILRTHDFAIVEKGGIGSVDEMAELLTHLQTGMKQKTPVSIMYEKPYQHFDRMMKEMEKQGLISKGDRDLYKIVRSPYEIAADLRARREAGLLRPGINKPTVSRPNEL
ncbi:MAG TPA: LOG family protein [Candidatus Melainabacteria bacterium]|nr:LOG family protein [Candidatus Melainabacteria bacterium]